MIMSENVTLFVEKLIIGDGKYIQPMPGLGGDIAQNLALPDNILAVDTVKKYPIGTKLVSGMRTFYYAYASGTCNSEWGCYKAKKTNTCAVAPTQATAAAMAAAYPKETLAAGAVGSQYVTVTIDTEIGVLTTGVLSENELAGGFIVIGNGSAQHPQMFEIISHPALATAGGSLTVKLDNKLITAVTAATTTIELMENPFYCVKGDGSGGDYVTFLGVCAPPAVASGEYFWLQTRGPAWVTSDSHTCDSAQDRTIVWVGNGSVVSSNDVTLESGFQIAGRALDMSGSTESNAPFIYLEGIE
jgi:hypothetical protein